MFLINSPYNWCPPNTLTPSAPNLSPSSSKRVALLQSDLTCNGGPHPNTTKPKQTQASGRKYIMISKYHNKSDDLKTVKFSQNRNSYFGVDFDFPVLSHSQRTVLFFSNLVQIVLSASFAVGRRPW